ncbi:unnamed protein product [Dovyalis caffra]|uniref:Eukaryotic translation initiation factor 3 subunit C N-terminal domain-containing protein n=1 Tax=Dovyalis caffra TaxID=77055 RepID=A0AAV1RZ30_9ROSI|nr:unnamed protein product [Dovyalis caffra]
MLSVLEQNVLEYIERVGNFKAAAKAALRPVELIYYKPQEVYGAMKNWLSKQVEIMVIAQPPFLENSRTMMYVLVSLMYKYGD